MSTGTPALDLDAIRELASEITAEPWMHAGSCIATVPALRGCSCDGAPYGHHPYCGVGDQVTPSLPYEVAEHILAARDAVPALLAEVARKDVEIDDLTRQRDHAEAGMVEAKQILDTFADRMDEHVYQEIASVLEDLPCDGDGLTMPERLADSRAEVVRLTAQRDAVLALHKPTEDATHCTGCIRDDDSNWSYWPCPTVAALTTPEVAQ